MLHDKLHCYQGLVQLTKDLHKIAQTLPKGYGYLQDQLRRAMASSVLNLAEGNARKSIKERRRFFEIARGSIAEVAACIDILFAFELVSEIQFQNIKTRCEVASKMLWKLN